MVRRLHCDESTAFINDIMRNVNISRHVTGTENRYFDCDNKKETSVCFNTNDREKTAIVMPLIATYIGKYTRNSPHVNIKTKQDVNDEKLFEARCLTGMTVCSTYDTSLSDIESAILNVLGMHNEDEDVKFEKYDFSVFYKKYSRCVFWVNFKSIKKAIAALNILQSVNFWEDLDGFFAYQQAAVPNCRLVFAQTVINAVDSDMVLPNVEDIMSYFYDVAHIEQDEKLQVVKNIYREFEYKMYQINDDDEDEEQEAGAEPCNTALPEQLSLSTLGQVQAIEDDFFLANESEISNAGEARGSSTADTISMSPSPTPSTAQDSLTRVDDTVQSPIMPESTVLEVEALKTENKKLSNWVMAIEKKIDVIEVENKYLRQMHFSAKDNMSPMMHHIMQPPMQTIMTPVMQGVRCGYYDSNCIFPIGASTQAYGNMVNAFQPKKTEYVPHHQACFGVKIASTFNGVDCTLNADKTEEPEQTVQNFSMLTSDEINEIFKSENIAIENIKNLRGGVFHTYLEKGDTKIMTSLLKSIGLSDFEIKFVFPSILTNYFPSLYSDMENKLLLDAE